jgi:cobalt-precorrin-5B (C1)-methyltransferase
MEQTGVVRKRGLRTGYTTGACAAAATRAAVEWLISGGTPRDVTITLPIGRQATFEVHRIWTEGDRLGCSVVKDAGDDPDVTHGAEICSELEVVKEPGLWIEGGTGVGQVTRPGIGLAVGEPAINPVPRRMIAEASRPFFESRGSNLGLRVIISVPDGEERARKTLNARLGIVGGLSILGTTGIVVPYSTAAFRASVSQAIDVALAAGQYHVVLTTGGRSEKFAQLILPHLPEFAFVQMGDFVGHALKECARKGVMRATIAGMVGKLSKIAAGKLQTHAAGSEVDLDFLAHLAGRCGASPHVQDLIRRANTARHFAEIAIEHGITGVFQLICEAVVANGIGHVSGRVAVECILMDFDGQVLGRAASHD